jgi:hypothetical protein
MAIRNIVGNVPEPHELYGREDLIEHLWRQLTGNNILVLAPRRFGKSGVMHHLLERPASGFIPVALDLMDLDSPAEFAVLLTGEVLAQSRLRTALHAAKGLPAALRRFITDNVGAVEFEGLKVELRQVVEANWRETVRRLMREMETVDATIVFLLDEFPVMLASMAERHGARMAQEFMAWFSSLRLHGKDVLRRHRYVIAGSIGIDTLLRRINPPDKLRDFERLPVGAIAEEHAMRLARDLAESLDIEIPDSLIQSGLDLIGPRVPYFIHLLFSQLAQLRPMERHPLIPPTLDRVYREQVLGPTCKHYFDHYRERLARYGKALERGAMAVLRGVADAPMARVSASALFDVYRNARGRGASEVEFDELLADLECDWYLRLDPETNEYHFMVNVMRDWWQRWYGVTRRAVLRTGGR